MQATSVPTPPARKGLTIAQLIVSGLGLIGGVLGAGIFVLLGVVSLAGATGASTKAVSLFAMGWINGLLALITLPSLFFSLQALMGWKLALPKLKVFWAASGAVLLWPAALLVGNWSIGQAALAWLLFPPLQILTVGLPIWWVIEFARRGLPSGSPQRRWGLINFSLLITTPLAIVVELVIFAILVGVVVLWLMGRPELVQEMQSLGQRMMSVQSDPEAARSILAPVLRNPVFILGMLAGLAGVIPLIEEMLKPLAIWFLMGRQLSPSEGFVAGAISGGGFALLESLLSLGNPAQQEWLTLAIGRVGTGLLHTTTTAMLGWAMARAWRDRSYLRLGLTYLLSCSLHGLWNAFSLFLGLGSILNSGMGESVILSGLTWISPIVLILLVVAFVAILWNINRRLQAPVLNPAPVLVETSQYS
jgi:hypothetical protein